MKTFKKFTKYASMALIAVGMISCSPDEGGENDNNNNNPDTNNLEMDTWVVNDNNEDSIFSAVSKQKIINDSQIVLRFIDTTQTAGGTSNSMLTLTFSGTSLPATGTYSLTNILAEGGVEPITSGKVEIMGVGFGGVVSSGEGSVSVTNENGVITIVGTNLPVKTFNSNSNKLSLKLKYSED